MGIFLELGSYKLVFDGFIGDGTYSVIALLVFCPYSECFGIFLINPMA